MRIISLVPSATEVLSADGVGAHVARTHECDLPTDAGTRPAMTPHPLARGRPAAEVGGVLSTGKEPR